MELDHAVSSGVNLRTLGPDTVPLQEEHDARIRAGIRLAEWDGLDVFEKALIIANRRINVSIANLQADAEIRNARRNAFKGKR